MTESPKTGVPHSSTQILGKTFWSTLVLRKNGEKASTRIPEWEPT